MMKTVVLFAGLFCLAWGYPKIEDEFQLRRAYIDPVEPVPKDFLPRITQGYEAPPHSIPYQVYIRFLGYGVAGWLCSGSLISRKFVLTSGNCVTGGINATVYLGAHNISTLENTQLRIVGYRLRRHERYNRTNRGYDIGLIELSEEVKLNKYIDVVRLPSRDQAHLTYEGANARVSGWGRVAGNGHTSQVLLEANSTIISNRLCDYYFGNLEDYQVCLSGTGGVGSCNGDGGGPLIVGNQQVGIVSYSASGCPDGYPSVFTRTNKFLDWLEEHTDLKF